MRLQKSLIAFRLSTLYLVPPITMKVTMIGGTKEELDDRNAEAFSSAIDRTRLKTSHCMILLVGASEILVGNHHRQSRVANILYIISSTIY